MKEETKECKISEEDCTFNRCSRWSTCELLIKSICLAKDKIIRLKELKNNAI